jgi:hypothetical protein
MFDTDEFYFEHDKPAFEKFKNRSPLIIKIKVYDRVDNKQIREHIRNFRNGISKDWLIDVIMWAVNNQKRVEIERKE